MKHDIDHIFSYHAPRDGQPAKYEAIRAAGRHFARIVLANTTEGEDQDIVIRHIRDAVMTANASIALVLAPSPGAVALGDAIDRIIRQSNERNARIRG